MAAEAIAFGYAARVLWRPVSFVLLVAACRGDSTEPAPPPAQRTERAPTEASNFGLYVLALSWAPSFCCGHPDKQECADLEHAFAGSHLTLHGLWPNYTDAQATRGRSYPQFCGAYAHCERDPDASCVPDPSTLPDEMRTLGPGYVGDHDFLADHEWPKHGSCTGLEPKAYFRAALDAMKALPGSGTPDVLAGAIGRDVAPDELAGAFGVPAESILLSCDASCALVQVSVCLDHDASGRPTTPVTCPQNTTRAQYDNGCITRHCDRITVPAAGRCDLVQTHRSGERHDATRPDVRRNSGHACNHPGQGPACTSDDECTAAGFVRCARSGCCTSQP